MDMLDSPMMGMMMLGGGLFMLLVVTVLMLGVVALVKYLRGRS